MPWREKNRIEIYSNELEQLENIHFGVGIYDLCKYAEIDSIFPFSRPFHLVRSLSSMEREKINYSIFDHERILIIQKKNDDAWTTKEEKKHEFK